ncbi:hypothetical protein [Halomicrobium katesii]|uniref:hypothetical protein n=1 Tax=Halomicrobium katesii TaxID=437163 RepID=UPI001B7F7EA1|nr:hypothetical protein [Halomicrobium katesii]
MTDKRDPTDDQHQPSHSIRVPEFRTIHFPEHESTLLDSVSPEEASKHRHEVESVELPESLATLVTDTELLNERPLFTWKWIYRIFGDELTLAAVPDSTRAEAQETKFLAGVYITLLDDLAERRNDAETFWELASVAYPGRTPNWERTGIDTAYADSARQVWSALESRLEATPNFDRLREPYFFDLRSCFQAMDFTRVANGSYGLMNLREIWQYETRAIGILGTVGADLFYIPSLDSSTYRTVRPILLAAQYLWRLGNWLITWRREAHEGDHTAVLFAEALQRGLISESDLVQLDGEHPAVADRVVEIIDEADLDVALAAEWERRHDHLATRIDAANDIDLDGLHTSMAWLMRSHLATEGKR